jgi:hypothetical protein
MPVAYPEQIITVFERHGIDANSRRNTDHGLTMSPQERSLIGEIGRLKPCAFGTARDVWLLSQNSAILPYSRTSLCVLSAWTVSAPSLRTPRYHKR